MTAGIIIGAILIFLLFCWFLGELTRDKRKKKYNDIDQLKADVEELKKELQEIKAKL